MEIIGGYVLIPWLADKVATLSNFTFKTEERQIVRQAHKKRRITGGQQTMSMVEKVVLDTKKQGIFRVALAALAFVEATLHESIDTIITLQEYKEKKIMLENQVECYKSNKDNMLDMIEYDLNVVQRVFLY